MSVPTNRSFRKRSHDARRRQRQNNDARRPMRQRPDQNTHSAKSAALTIRINFR
jgi:hypothetical protein